MCGSSPLLPRLEETACPQPIEFSTQIFSFDTNAHSSSSQHDADLLRTSNFHDDALIIGAFTDVLFGDETSESFASFTAPFAAEGGEDEEEAAAVGRCHGDEDVARASFEFAHAAAARPTIVREVEAGSSFEGRADEDAALIDQFVVEYLDPCFGPLAEQAKALRSRTAALAVAETEAPLKTAPRALSRPRSNGRGIGLTVPVVPTVPVAPSVPLPQPNTAFASRFHIPAPAAPAAPTAAPFYHSGPAFEPKHAAAEPAPYDHRRFSRATDFKSKAEYRRLVAIPRYLEKRKRRRWNQGPSFATRTSAAHRRPRSNGKFSRSMVFVSASELK